MIRTVAETGSTNADIATRLVAGDYVPEGEWLVADRQTGGRGRLGRAWSDGLGNFMGSTVVRPGLGDPPPGSLALLSGLAVHQAVSGFLPDSGGLALKWPNDLLLDGAKLAGILLEVVCGTVVVGIGVNLRTAPEVTHRRVAAVADCGVIVSRDDFAAELAAIYDAELERWRTAGLAPLLRRWQNVAHPKGTRLLVSASKDQTIEGEFAGLAEEGNLLLRLSDGTLRTIHSGEVLLAPNPH